MKLLDMTGKPCPIPVIEAKKALAEAGAQGVDLMVDNLVAVQNLEKMAKGMGYRYAWTSQAEDRHRVEIRMEGAPPPQVKAPAQPQTEAPATAAGEPGGVTVLVGADHMGRGSEELGKILIKGYLYSLTQLPVPPRAVLFLNSGVKLTVEGSNALEDLRALEEKGVPIRSCGTCLNYYGVTEELAVGEITDMYGISTALAEAAGSVVCL